MKYSSLDNAQNLRFLGNNWKVISGKKEGQTQVSASVIGGKCKWCFPIDIHLATAGIQGNFLCHEKKSSNALFCYLELINYIIL